ncbi:LysR family transcriptional regulator [Achromobacter marplatensis]|uniref:LysR family transcriptional regulator n=1 Tax=Achromobacter marplatensis TaxID=470868 RepID=A0ABX9GMY4_9BURK|nr:LysR substrate-binding domain-containing protein [Achromobacter marplatensis]OWT72080.1 LysR family transcriptional regulator [Achromobacter marplatensis]RBP24651.1 LysR family transcriptional regulator [Achromobacter marplatensis]CAB3625374.1 putative HTH-type transcriptional regulator YahB [Achromobacter marplatensis]
MLTVNELALLEAIRDSGSLSRAAVKLGRAPSSVSHAARQLEERFDALLFDRRRYRLQLTPAGQLLADEAARLMLDVSRLTQRVKQVASGWEDRLHIVSDEILEFELMSPLIQAFDRLDSGVTLRFTHEVLGGTWEALREGRADLIVGATNEPQSMPNLQWAALGEMEWLFAVSRRHPLAKVKAPLRQDQIQQHRAVVVADTARGASARAYGRVGGQAVLAVPSMRAKILAQRDGLGVGWVPRHRVASLLERGELVEKATETPREPNLLYLAWRGGHEGRALQWWLEALRQPKMALALMRGIDAFG